MPTFINNYYEYALLAQASYADNAASATSLQNDADFSSSQANQFISDYRFIIQSDDTVTGFSGTFYEILSGPNTGQIVYALRGTDFPSSVFDVDEVIEFAQDALDFGDIGFGVVADQISEMINFYFRAITPVGQQAKQYGISVQNTLPSLPFIPLPGGDYLVLTQSFTADGLEILQPGDPLTVTGHSLGGYLSEVFTYLFNNVVTETYTFNGAGFNSDGLTELGNLLSGITDPVNVSPSEPSPTSVANIAVPGDLVHQIPTLEHYGLGRILFETEHSLDSTFFNAFDTHNQQSLTDSLAVYDVFSTMDNSLSISVISGLLRNSSNAPNDSLEGLVNALIDQFNVATPAVGIDDRDALYTALDAIHQNITENSYTVVPIGGHIAHLAQGSSESARGYRYALVNLLPFAVTSNLANTAAMDATYNDTYSNEFLRDRALMLGAVLECNGIDSTHPRLINGQPIYFDDRFVGNDVFAGQNELGTVQQNDVVNIVFDDGSAHSLSGGKNDCLMTEISWVA